MELFADLEHDYEAAWREWEASGGQAVWSTTADDRIVDVVR